MIPSISPYLLLKASIPRQVTRSATPYDLFSASQFSTDDQALQQIQPQIEREESSRSAPVPKRAHYIADIQAKHISADRRSVPI